MNKRKIISLLEGIESNIKRINCILSHKFNFSIAYEYDPYIFSTETREREKIYLNELTIGTESMNQELRQLFKKLKV